MDKDWTVACSVKNPEKEKDLQVKFLKKHLQLSTTKLALPRKGDNKPDIGQDVHGNGMWVLIKDMPRISFPFKGELHFHVNFDGHSIYKFSGNYELPDLKGIRNLNWHAEKHITKARDGVLLRLENGSLASVRVFVPSACYSTTNGDEPESPQKKKLSLGLPKSPSNSKFVAPLPLQKKNGDTTPTKLTPDAKSKIKSEIPFKSPKMERQSADSVASSLPSSQSQRSGSSPSLSRSSSMSSIPTSVEEPPPLKRTSTLPDGSNMKSKSPLRASSSSEFHTPTKGSQDLRSPSPTRLQAPSLSSQSPSLKRVTTPPNLKRTVSKTSPKPKKALLIAKVVGSSQQSSSSSSSSDSQAVYIQGENEAAETDNEQAAGDNLGGEEDMIEEIVVPQKFYDYDSEEEVAKKVQKKKPAKKSTESSGKSSKPKEEIKSESEKTSDKPKKKKKQIMEEIDLEEILSKKRENGSSQVIEGTNGKKKKDKEVEVIDLSKKKLKEKEQDKMQEKAKKKVEVDTPKRKQVEVIFDEDNDFEDSQPQKKKVKKAKEKEKAKAKEKEKEKLKVKTTEKEAKTKKEKPRPKKDDSDDDFVQILDEDMEEIEDEDDDMEEVQEVDDEVEQEVKEGERLKYSDTLQYFQEERDEESETSDYEYSGVDLLFDDGELPSSQTPSKPTVNTATNGVAPAPAGEDADDGQVHSKDEALLYSQYRPRVDSDVYCPHPANVVEAHTLASVVLPECTYKPSLPKACTKEGGLSSLQLETVAMVGMRHTIMLQDGTTRGGYFIGDGTGVGKGRQIAAILADNFLKGRTKAIWFSVTTTLYKDARRDLDDIGCGEEAKNYIPLLQMPSKTTETIPSKGILFATYSTLVSKGTRGAQSRFDQIMKWCGKDFEGVIVFDEGHAAKNLNPGKSGSSQTGQRVFQLQEDLPKARIVYVSATGATEPQHMGYMTRLGLWGPGTEFPDFKFFAKEISDAGVGAMEMVAMEMKGRGLYCSRYLSFEGTTFEILKHHLNAAEAGMYDQAVRVWDSILSVGLEMKAHRPTIWAAHQRFFLQMILSTKVADCASIVKTELARGCAVVIGLFSTGEALVDDKDEETEELFSAPQQILLNVVEKISCDPNGLPIPEMESIRKSFEEEIKALHLPENPLDKLIDELGGVKKVAEMTGRRKRFVRTKHGFKLENRDSKEENLAERDRFQKGDKNIAIISDAASMGISLQADLSCKNTKQRVHIILQLPWAADKAVQQLGRTHRSHQASAPIYKLIITDLGGEWRLASTIAARLASLGALTNADRRAAAASKSLSKFLLQPRYVLDALRAVESDLQQNVEATDLFKKFIFMECNGGGNNAKTKKFLNRLLGFNIESQKKLFDLFMNQYERQVLQAQKEGRFDDGVYDLQGELVSGPETLYISPMDSAQVTEKYVIAIDRGVEWKKAVQFLKDADKTKQGTAKVVSGPRNGFYKQNTSGQVILAIQRLDSKYYFHVCKPHVGHQRGYMTRQDLKDGYKLIPVQTAKRLWKYKYENADGEGKGQRMVHQTIIFGSVLPIFSILIATLKGDKIQIVRARCGTKRLVGVHLHEDYMKDLTNNLRVLENNTLIEKRRQSLQELLAVNGVTLDPNENLETLKHRVPTLSRYLDAGNLVGIGRKRKKAVEQYTESDANGVNMKGIIAPVVSNQRLEDVAQDVVGYVRRRALRRQELNTLIETSGIPDLRQYNSILCNTYVSTDTVTTTARSIVDTLKSQYATHAPRLAFLRKCLENAPTPVHYNKVIELYKAEHPKGTEYDITSTLQLPKSITRVEYHQHEFLVWKK